MDNLSGNTQSTQRGGLSWIGGSGEAQLSVDMIDEMKDEYISTLKTPPSSDEIKLAFSDLQVWLYNKDCERSLECIRKVWDSLPDSVFGTKQLQHLVRDEFLAELGKQVIQSYQKFCLLKEDLPLQMKMFENAVEVYKRLAGIDNGVVDIDTERIVQKTGEADDISEQQVDSLLKEQISCYFYSKDYIVDRMEIYDLRSSFQEGFEGYSMGIQHVHKVTETQLSDVNGRKISFKDRPLAFNLFEYANRYNQAPKIRLATLQIDPFTHMLDYITNEQCMVQHENKNMYFPIQALQLIDDSHEDAPLLTYGIRFKSQSPLQIGLIIKNRIRLLALKIKAISNEIQRTRRQINLYIAPFPRIHFEDDFISIKNGIIVQGGIRLTENSSKPKKSCLIIQKMSTYAMSRIRNDTESLSRAEKSEQETRRFNLTLITRYLQSAGYNEAAAKVITDSGISLERFDLADNIDLTVIVKEFQEYYNIKFSRYPTLLKKGTAAPEERKRPPPAGRGKAGTVAGKKSARSGSIERADSLELAGTSVAKKQVPPKQDNLESNQDYYDNRLLKPLPDYPNDLKELAQNIQRDIIMVNPDINFQQIVGLAEPKRLLKEAVLMPMKYASLFTGILEPWKGILFFGPPGTGKTMLAKAVATECRTTFFNISASSIVSKWRGDSEKLVRILFELARHYQPSTIFIDEIDSIMSSRDSGEHEGSRRMKTELLIQLDGLVKTDERVFILAASNMPWDLDAALLRRLEKRVSCIQILVPLPEFESRVQMLQALLPPDKTQGVDYQEIARQLEGYSGSDIKLLCKESAMKPVRRLMSQMENMDPDMVRNWHIPADPKLIPRIDPVMYADIVQAMESTRPASHIEPQKYEEWFARYGSI